MSLYDHFSMDPKAEIEGVDLDYGDAGCIKIARAGGSNQNYNKRISGFQKKYRRQMDLDILTDETAERELISIYVDTIILGWTDVSAKDGSPLLFSPKNVAMLLKDLPELFADIRAQSTNLALFREIEREEDSGN